LKALAHTAIVVDSVSGLLEQDAATDSVTLRGSLRLSLVKYLLYILKDTGFVATTIYGGPALRNKFSK